jgi:hypothetical protein
MPKLTLEELQASLAGTVDRVACWSVPHRPALHSEMMAA